MKKTITLLTILLLVFFMVGCENSINPIITENQTESFVQSENAEKISAKPFGVGNSGVVAKKGPKPPKPPKPNKWHVPGDFATIQLAIDSDLVADGDKIEVGAGKHFGAFVTKEVEIKGKKGKKGEDNKTIIDDGPEYGGGLYMGFYFLAGSDGSKIKDITFTTDFPIMSSGVNNVEIHHCNFYNSIQAISNWAGSGWKIKHNNIVDLNVMNGGGIGILIADYMGGIVENNIVEHNKIVGTLFVPDGDGGNYSGSGIELFADFRWGEAGAFEIKNNLVKHNKVSMTSNNPSIVDVVGFGLSEVHNDGTIPTGKVIFDNIITKNDFKGTTISIDLTPESLSLTNILEKNKVN